jgi:hypothetical protein
MRKTKRSTVELTTEIKLKDQSVHPVEFELAKKVYTVICDYCRQKITLTRHADPDKLQRHRGSKSCTKASQKAARLAYSQQSHQPVQSSVSQNNHI